MRIERIVYALLIIASAGLAAVNWRKAVLFQTDNEALRARVEGLENEVNQSSLASELVKTSTEKLRTQTSELLKLRNEVTQLRANAKSSENLAGEIQRLRAQNQQLQAQPQDAAATAPSASTEN